MPRGGGGRAPAATPYVRGRRLEYRVRHALEQQGYLVIRSAGSRGVVDLLAIDARRRRILAIQVKAPGSKLSRAEVEKLRELRGVYTLVPACTVEEGGRLRIVEVE